MDEQASCDELPIKRGPIYRAGYTLYEICEDDYHDKLSGDDNIAKYECEDDDILAVTADGVLLRYGCDGSRQIINNNLQTLKELSVNVTRSYTSTFTIDITKISVKESQKIYNLLLKLKSDVHVICTSDRVTMYCDVLPKNLRRHISSAEIREIHCESLILPNLRRLVVNVNTCSGTLLCEFTKCVKLEHIMFYGSSHFPVSVTLLLYRRAQIVAQGQIQIEYQTL